MLQLSNAIEQENETSLVGLVREESTGKNQTDTATQYAGVKVNAKGDLDSFISGTLTNIVLVFILVVIFRQGMQRYPMMYLHGFRSGRVTAAVEDTFLGWARASAKMGFEEHVKYCGLDQAMLLQYAVMATKIALYVGLPLFCIMSPVYLIYGDGEAKERGDRLSYISMGNIKEGSTILYPINGLITLYVTWTVRREVFNAMEFFCRARIKWLRNIPSPQSTTVMVEGIPGQYQSKETLERYFAKFFNDIQDVRIVKIIPGLEDAVGTLEDAEKNLAKAEAEWAQEGNDPKKRPVTRLYRKDAIEYYTGVIQEYTDTANKLRAEAQSASSKVGGVNGTVGFVTFQNLFDANTAISQTYSANKNYWIMSQAPAPADLVWADLKVGEERATIKSFVGYSLATSLYMCFTPVCIGITNLASSVPMGPLQASWDAYAPTFGLLIFLNFTPTVLVLIFNYMFHFKSKLVAQAEVQHWYFWFLFFFVIMVTAIGQGFKDFASAVSEHPLDLPLILADKMPVATHYYLHYIAVQWMSHGMELTRYIYVFKYWTFSKLYEEETARSMSEPEDQDYYGIGSRSARFSAVFSICVIFGTLSPLLNILTAANFAMCRIMFGYLLVWAEGKKGDSGGVFFVNQLKHTLFGLVAYNLLMVGVFLRREAADNKFAAVCGVLALIYTCRSIRQLMNDFQWKTLPAEEAIDQEHHSQSTEKYIQPELVANTTSMESEKVAK
eukprot:TRINITY_DN4714_c0_g1_i1.p1 TRINITY_DN4714_c0_g1~~TRINITY_DN4714_c0_g1_i1.p1  ORF type:complete len:780 (+),score=110.56 TRINITY_DN4714_c0_g1_i1:166-2340(+)